jgi:mycofactocin precursor peptide peptidase
VILNETTWPSLAEKVDPVLLIPLGSTEQHGPHLPFGTDSFIAEAIAKGAAVRLAGTLIGPTVNVTASGEHQGFPGTLSIGTEVFSTMLTELVRSASTWCRRIVFVNGHGGNTDAIRRAAKVWVHEGRNVSVWSPSLPELGDWHAGWVETSVMLLIRPELVGAMREKGETDQTSEVMSVLLTRGVSAVSLNGVLGDPTSASVDLGTALLAGWIDSLVATMLSAKN